MEVKNPYIHNAPFLYQLLWFKMFQVNRSERFTETAKITNNTVTILKRKINIYTVHMSHIAFATPILISSFMIYCQSRVPWYPESQTDIHIDKLLYAQVTTKIFLCLLNQPCTAIHKGIHVHFTCKVLILTEKGDEVGLFVVRFRPSGCLVGIYRF